jgi:lysyl-tRNA synthetase class II
MEAFEVSKREYECQFWEPSHTRLRELAREYLKVTEDYDQMVCSHRKGNIAIPVTREERSLCSQFASVKMHEYIERAQGERLTGEMSFRDALRREEREFERTYRFQLTPEVKSSKLP